MGQDRYYSRQILLSEVGKKGQQKLREGKCLVIGAGGLGSPALLYLASAGIGTLGVCDFDLVDESNLHRQPLYSSEDIGKPKAAVAVEKLKKLNPYIQCHAHPERFASKNAKELLSAYDIVLDCTDHFSVKFLINDTAAFANKPVIRASIYQFEGQIQFYDPRRGDACLRCLWKQMPQEGCVGSCQEVGVLGPVPGFFGVLQAMEAVKFFLGLELLASNEILFYDLLDCSQQKILIHRNPQCPACGPKRSMIDDLTVEITVQDLEKRIQEFQIVDIREPVETALAPLESLPHLKMPLSQFDPSNLQKGKKYLFFCQRGMRSRTLVSRLNEQGYDNVFSLSGGFNACVNFFSWA